MTSQIAPRIKPRQVPASMSAGEQGSVASRLLLRNVLRIVAVVTVAGCWLSPASAQGLIRSLPAENGAWAKYEGTVKQTRVEADAATGNVVVEWTRHLMLVALGEEMAEIDGEQVPCRWIEIRSSTGRATDDGIATGPAGPQLIRVLVPSSKIIATAADESGIPVASLPIVKGFRRVGMGEVRPVTGSFVQISPVFTAVRPFVSPTIEAEQQVETPAGNFQAVPESATEVIESRQTRVTTEAELFSSTAVPFGLAK